MAIKATAQGKVRASANSAPRFSVDYWRYLALAGLIGLGVVTYFVAGTLIGAFSLTEFRSQLRRR